MRNYTTEAIVLGSRKLGDADRIVDLFTETQGRVPTVVKGVRKVTSRWGGRLEPFTLLQVQLHEGRNLHTLTGADTVITHASARRNTDCLAAGLSVVEMISRSTPEFHRKPRTYNLMLSFLAELDSLDAAPLRDRHDGEEVDARTSRAAVLALGTQMKMLLLAGFLPHLLSCSLCGADNTELTGFSAQAGGALCAGCRQGSFAIHPGSLEAMRRLLENPLSKSADVEVNREELRQIRRAIREICEFHLGIRLKVEPWFTGSLSP
jgi:DNA repair protein RecO (recombination protein O)